MDLKDATKSALSIEDIHVCISTSQIMNDDDVDMLPPPPVMPPIRSTWTIAGSTTDTNGSSTTTRGRRRFRRRMKTLKDKREPPTIQMRLVEIESTIMEVTFGNTACNVWSENFSTDMFDADVSSLSDHYCDLSDDESGGDSASESSSPGTRIATVSKCRRSSARPHLSWTPVKSNASRKVHTPFDFMRDN
jgi:hypothetical protein